MKSQEIAPIYRHVFTINNVVICHIIYIALNYFLEPLNDLKITKHDISKLCDIDPVQNIAAMIGDKAVSSLVQVYGYRRKIG